MTKKGIILVDDHELFRAGLKYIIEKFDGYYVMAEAENGQSLLNQLKYHSPDIILMDISMPVMNGIDATRQCLRDYPEMKIIALSMYSDNIYYQQMIEAGAKGFVLKDSGKTEFQQALDTVSSGGNYFSQELLCQIIKKLNEPVGIVNELTSKHTKFSDRELEVLQLVCAGLSNAEIGEQLFLSVKTIEGHKSKLLQKTGAKNTAGLVMFAIKHRLINT